RVRCAVCEGAGLIDKERSYTVKIPPGSIGGSTQRLPREGAPGRRGGSAGDLHVIVRVRPHAFYGRESTREGDVLTVDLPLTFAEAALGAEVEVPVLDAAVKMRVPPGTQSGAVFRLRGKGFPRGSGRGDVHVRLAIETPTGLSDDTRAQLARLAPALASSEHPRRRALREVLDRASGSAEPRRPRVAEGNER
ncbi:MAG TPA: DnaJ C-terminal domain-containing protein, partial [Polyangia bacterium]|nr:DnaJ C-terminal domain-containing protein [Polyangia bacterium]